MSSLAIGGADDQELERLRREGGNDEELQEVRPSQLPGAKLTISKSTSCKIS